MRDKFRIVPSMVIGMVWYLVRCFAVFLFSRHFTVESIKECFKIRGRFFDFILSCSLAKSRHERELCFGFRASALNKETRMKNSPGHHGRQQGNERRCKRCMLICSCASVFPKMENYALCTQGRHLTKKRH